MRLTIRYSVLAISLCALASCGGADDGLVMDLEGGKAECGATRGTRCGPEIGHEEIVTPEQIQITGYVDADRRLGMGNLFVRIYQQGGGPLQDVPSLVDHEGKFVVPANAEVTAVQQVQQVQVQVLWLGQCDACVHKNVIHPQTRVELYLPAITLVDNEIVGEGETLKLANNVKVDWTDELSLTR